MIAAVLASVLVATAPADDPVQATVARVETVAARATMIEAIVGMGAVDSAMRTAMLEASKNLPPDQRDAAQKAAGPLIIAQDKVHVARLKAIIAEHGWPKISQTSERTSAAAMTLVNHAGFDTAFRRQVLALIEPLAKTGEARPEDYARLYDRLATDDKRLQRYGTQGGPCKDGKHAVPTDLEDPANVEQRRAAVGLQPMAEYLASLDKTYGACVSPN